MVAVLHIGNSNLQGNPDVIQSIDFDSGKVAKKLVDVNDDHYMFTFAS